MAIELIRAIYDSTFPLPDKEEYYQAAIEDIEFFQISSQIYHLLKESGQLVDTPLFFQERLKIKYVETLYQNLFIKNQTKLILQEFEKKEIEVIPLKGVLFAEKYFGHIGARGTSDIDLLIREEDLENAIDCIVELGFYHDHKPIPSEFNLSFNKELPQSRIPLMIELHWNIVDPRTSGLQIEEFWDNATPFKNCLHVKKLSDFHTFYMIILHGWRHNLDSLKYFIDIIQLIFQSKEKLELNKLFQLGKVDFTLKRIIRTLSIVYNQFPFLEKLAPLTKRKKYILWDYRNFRHKHLRTFKKYADFIDYELLSYDSLKHSLTEFSTWLFPPRAYTVNELGKFPPSKNMFFVYIQLYIKRGINFSKSILLPLLKR